MRFERRIIYIHDSWQKLSRPLIFLAFRTDGYLQPLRLSVDFVNNEKCLWTVQTTAIDSSG